MGTNPKTPFSGSSRIFKNGKKPEEQKRENCPRGGSPRSLLTVKSWDPGAARPAEGLQERDGYESTNQGDQQAAGGDPPPVMLPLSAL